MLYKQNVKLASAYIVLSGLMFAIMGACIKFISADMSTELVVFFRNFFGFLLLIPLIFVVKGDGKEKTLRQKLVTTVPLWHLARSLFGLAAMYCFFYSIAYIPLAESVLLSYTTPLFAPFMAYFLLKERVSSHLMLAILLGFVGVFFLLHPEFNAFSWVSFIALGAGLFASAAMTIIRKLSKTEPTTRIVFYYGLICTLLSSIPLLWVSQWPDIDSLMVLIAVGMFATAGQFFLTKGYSTAAVAQVGPFVYSTVVFASLIAWFVWSEVPTLYAAFGIVLVVIAGSIALRKTAVLK